MDRANAFSIYMAQLASANGRGDDGFSRALEMCQLYGEVLRDQVDHDWREQSTPTARYAAIRSHLNQFITCERWIDRRFARGNQAEVPRALKTIAREQLEAHGLTHHEPVLTVGPPDSFETHEPSLYDHLFGDLHLAETHEALERHRGLTLSIISMPYIEGTTTLWYPITLGHEIAHLRIDATKGNAARTELMSALLDPAAESKLAALIAEGGRPNMRETPSEILNRWVDELLCDLNAVRLFGPAGLSAIAEFVGVLAPAQASAEFPTVTHPPLSLRLNAMRRLLEQDGKGVLPRYVQVWGQSFAGDKDPLPYGSGIDAYTSDILVEVFEKEHWIDRLIEHVCAWQLPHEPPSNPTAVHWVKDALLDGVPGGTHYEDERGEWRDITIADVVNGAWAARDAFEPPADDAAEAAETRGLLADLDTSFMPEHEKRRRVDILASKAIDSVELARLWGDEEAGDCRIISPDSRALEHFLSADGPAPDGEQGDASEVAAGVLAASRIVRRMRLPKTAASRRLVVTPLFANSVHQAGIDVRLGPEFIVFKHAGSAVFDPLTERRDPRVLQESVHMGWGEKFFLHPGELVLAATLEYVVVPEDVAAQVVTRSSYGRLGLTTATAVQVQPSSRGCITLELVNHSNTPIALSPGARVGQLMLFPVADARPSAFGRYWFPVGPEFSKVGKDADAQHLIALGEEAGRVGGRGDISFSLAADVRALEFFENAAAPLFASRRSMEGDGKGVVAGKAPATSLAKAIHVFLTSFAAPGLIVMRARSADPKRGGIQLSLAAEGDCTDGDVSFRAADGTQIEALAAGAGIEDLADALARFRARRPDPMALAV